MKAPPSARSKKGVDEGCQGGTLGKKNQRPKKEHEDDDGHEPPSLSYLEETPQLFYYVDLAHLTS